MNKVLQFVIFFGLWVIRDSFGQLLADPTQTSPEREMDVSSGATLTSEINLQERSSSSDAVVITIAPDETCGYLSGRPLLPITYENQQPCMWARSLGILCGNLDNDKTFDVHFTCLDREAALNTNLCNDTCTSNPVYLLCTDESAPYCGTIPGSERLEGFDNDSAELAQYCLTTSLDESSGVTKCTE
ncbi:unnamed protein product [Fusarium langsethiae]|nr:unnamed protein product [Fusarium langsethiae]